MYMYTVPTSIYLLCDENLNLCRDSNLASRTNHQCSNHWIIETWCIDSLTLIYQDRLTTLYSKNYFLSKPGHLSSACKVLHSRECRWQNSSLSSEIWTCQSGRERTRKHRTPGSQIPTLRLLKQWLMSLFSLWIKIRREKFNL